MAKPPRTYLSRGRRARKNMIVVSHGIMVQTCLKVLPSTAACDVASIPYCGGLMAGFCRSRQISKQTSTDSELDDMAHFTPKTPSHDLMEDFWPETDFESRVSPTSEHLAQAELHGRRLDQTGLLLLPWFRYVSWYQFPVQSPFGQIGRYG